uniref:Uncharacterized protein n=1 Tax=Sphaerodactylus townsendi TaxID=933632 RepID=A0ACB8FCP8_9SAUR
MLALKHLPFLVNLVQLGSMSSVCLSTGNSLHVMLFSELKKTLLFLMIQFLVVQFSCQFKDLLLVFMFFLQTGTILLQFLKQRLVLLQGIKIWWQKLVGCLISQQFLQIPLFVVGILLLLLFTFLLELEVMFGMDHSHLHQMQAFFKSTNVNLGVFDIRQGMRHPGSSPCTDELNPGHRVLKLPGQEHSRDSLVEPWMVERPIS